MNPIIVLATVYCLITIGSSCILYFSFKGRVDQSGRYFLLSESLMIPGLMAIIAVNAYPETQNHIIYFVGYALHIIAGLALVFSIASLTKDVKTSHFYIATGIALLYSGVMEITRGFNQNYPILLFAISSLTIAALTYKLCNSVPDPELKSNPFLKWIKYIEAGLICFAGIRLLAWFVGIQVSAENPSPQLSLIYSINVALNVFRYIAYQSLRISWVDSRTSAVNSLNSNLVKLVKEKNRFLQGLITSNRALGISALANSLAHQLSQPITGVILQTESVKRDLIEFGGQQQSVQTLNTVTEQLDKISTLINNLRKLFGDKESDFKAFNMLNACDEVLEVIGPTLDAKRIVLVKHYENIPMAHGNATQIQQVLINIFNNAIDAIDASCNSCRQIDLFISQNEDFAIVTVQDSGIGLTSEVINNMFELYQSTKSHGLGIGLWLSKTIIDRHTGDIRVSKGSLGGAIFEIYIPLSNNQNEAT